VKLDEVLRRLANASEPMAIELRADMTPVFEAMLQAAERAQTSLEFLSAISLGSPPSPLQPDQIASITEFFGGST
jgi:hypothetical protein